ncbi:hypothetical protein ACVD2U_004169 [Vibrio parahaemolyticus]|nr:hypothetical protein [Vibrio parahaemolyticus]
MAKKTIPNVGITDYCGELDLSDFDIALPEQSPLPTLIKDLPIYVTDESKKLMVAAKDLKGRLEELSKALATEYDVEHPMRYTFKVKNSKGLPKITWYRLILYRYPKKELEEKEVSDAVLRRFSHAMDWEIPLYLHLLDQLNRLEQRMKPIRELSSQVRKTMRAIEKLHI